MGKIKEIKIDRFNQGMFGDPRTPVGAGCRVVSNFDILTHPYRMVPYRSSEDGDSGSSTSRKQNFTLGETSGTTYLFGLGVKSGAGTAEILRKSVTTGGSDDLSDDGWGTPSYNQSPSGVARFELFTHYKKTGMIYGVSGQNVWAFDAGSGSTAWGNTESDLGATVTHLSNGIVHPQDDILYFGYRISTGSYIAKNDDGSWSNTALTLPFHLYPVSVTPFGNYLAIACAPVSGIGHSFCYLWDKQTALETVSEVIDLGDGEVKFVEEVDGTLIFGILSGGRSIRLDGRIEFRYYTGGGRARNLLEVVDEATSGTALYSRSQVINGRVHFMAQITLNGTLREGVFSLGRSAGGWTLVHERTPDNDTALSSSSLLGFFYVGDFLFQAYVSSSAYYVSKTNDQDIYTGKSIWESLILSGDDISKSKKLVGVTVSFEPLPADGQVVLKYKKDEETSYSTIFTHNTDDAISHSAVKIESTGATLPEFKEIQFRIESTGGAVITGMKLHYEEIEKDLY